MSLELSFLTVPLAPPPARQRPVNVYDILREGWRETRVDMTLQFFLDPTERHGLGPLVMDALLTLLDGAPTIGPVGQTTELFRAADHLGSDSWEISTQVDFIDVYAVNRDLGIGVVLENKIGHVLNNPLGRYASRALREDEITMVLVAVLAPERRSASVKQQNWLSRALTYDELSQQIRTSSRLIDFLLSPADLDQRRSLDLLQQFIEARSGDVDMADIRGEAAVIDDWRKLVEEHQVAIKRFDQARKRTGRLLRDRNKRLEPLIALRMADVQWEFAWESHGGSGVETWNAYHFPTPDWSVELKFSSDPARPSVFVYDYRGRTYKQSAIEPLGLDWIASDEEIADAFVDRLNQILTQVVSGTRLPHDVAEQ